MPAGALGLHFTCDETGTRAVIVKASGQWTESLRRGLMQTQAERESFLCDAGWSDAVRSTFGGIFSTRHYERLVRGDEEQASAILMCAEKDQKTDIFVHLALLLRRLEIPAPQILPAIFRVALS